MSHALAFHSSQSDPSHQSAPRIGHPVHPSKLHYTQQVHQLFALAPYGILASLVNSGILVALLWSVVPQGPIAWWFLSVLIVNGLWGFLLYRYRQYAKHKTSVDRWANWFITGNAASGCIWGIGGILLYPSTSIGHEVFLAFVFGGMIAGATALYASYFPAFLAFSLPTVTPLTLLFFSRGDSLHISMGAMGLLFVIIMTMTTRRNHTMLLESMTLHQENSTLIKDLTQARDSAEALNNSLSKEVTHRAAIEEELRRHQEHLETLVEARTAALQSSESRYRFVTENISDVIWMMEPDGNRFSYVSPSVKELRGYSAEEVMPMSLDECLTPSSFEKAQLVMRQELDRLAKEPRQQGPSIFLELEHRCKDGSTVWAEVRASLLLDEKGNPLGFAGVTRDLTERRKIDREKLQLEAQLLRSQKMDAIGTLAGGIAHDFNNLLTSILGNITLTQHIMKLPPLGEKYLTRAEQATWRAKDLTQQLLAFAKGGDPIKHLISLRDLIIESSGFALSGSSVLCERHLATNLWPIEADPGQVSQIIHNIGINAVQAMPNGGTLVIKADNMWINKSPGGFPIPLPPGPYVHVTLSDEGIGIAKEQLDKIFDPYFSTKPEGQGLGLASTYAIMQKHGGNISVESQTNVGTKFSLYFPACASGAIPIKLGTAPLQHGRGTILVMDDEEPIRLLSKEMLSHCGYQCELAKDGHETITFFQQARERHTPFSAVILDLTVPGSLGGKDTILRLREIDPHVIAFVSSGYSNDPIMANYKTYGFHGVITKPYSLIGLSTILHRSLSVIPPPSDEASLPNLEATECSDSDTH
jgi:PAS domain S-box-containing protein